LLAGRRVATGAIIVIVIKASLNLLGIATLRDLDLFRAAFDRVFPGILQNPAYQGTIRTGGGDIVSP
jgi:hypothetical protein